MLAISQCNEVDQVGCIIINATEVKKAMLAVGRSACNPRIRIIALVSDMDVHHTHFHIFLPYNHPLIPYPFKFLIPPCASTMYASFRKSIRDKSLVHGTSTRTNKE